MTTVKMIAVGNSAGIVLPKEVLDRLCVSKGDLLHIIETQRGIELTTFAPDFEAQVDVAEKVMQNRRDALKKLGQ